MIGYEFPVLISAPQAHLAALHTPLQTLRLTGISDGLLNV